jgi:hypothetical protein
MTARATDTSMRIQRLESLASNLNLPNHVKEAALSTTSASTVNRTVTVTWRSTRNLHRRRRRDRLYANSAKHRPEGRFEPKLCK